MKGQKEAVVEIVKAVLGPTFKPYQDIALVKLTNTQLESIKSTIGQMIAAGNVDYGKDRHNLTEVRAYARSMVMNHLKKARELNGNQVYGQTKAMVQSKAEQKKLSSINMDILPDDLKTFVKTLV